MIIKRGYWNCYMSFQLNSFQDIEKGINRKQFFKYFLSYCPDKERVFRNWDFDNYKGSLNEYVEEYEYIAKKTMDGLDAVHFRNTSSDEGVVFLMKPLVLYYKNKELFCPVFLYVSITGLGMLKLRVPLIDIEAEEFMSTSSHELYESFWMYDEYNNNQYKEKRASVDVGDNCLEQLLSEIIQATFEGHLLSGYKQLWFETILILDSHNPDVRHLGSNDNYKDLYHLAYPDSFLEQPDDSKLAFFRENNINTIMGLKFLRGFRGRMIVFGDIEKLKALHGWGEEIDSLEYFENTLQYTFDWAICAALWKRTNQMSFLDISTTNIHTYSYNKAKYNVIENDLDYMMDLPPEYVIEVFNLVYKGTDGGPSIEKRLERVSQLEHYIRDKYTQRRDLIFTFFALLFTMVFSLPIIRETVSLLLQVKKVQKPYYSINNISVAIWVLLIAIIGLLLFCNWHKYRLYDLFQNKKKHDR